MKRLNKRDREHLRNAVRIVGGREARVLDLRFWQNHEIEKIARKMRISWREANDLIEKAKREVRKVFLNHNKLRSISNDKKNYSFFILQKNRFRKITRKKRGVSENYGKIRVDRKTVLENKRSRSMKEIAAHFLYWVNEKTGINHIAGVAFYSEKFDEYRLKIDFFPENQYYLKTIGLHGNRVDYRAEVVNKKNGRFNGRRPIGIGYLDRETGNEIHIELSPFTRKLILSL